MALINLDYPLSKVDNVFAQFTGIQARFINFRQLWQNHFSLKSLLSMIACDEWPDASDPAYNTKCQALFAKALGNVLNIESGLFGSRAHISLRQRVGMEIGAPFIGRDSQCSIIFLLIVPIIAISCDENSRAIFNSNIGSVKVPNVFIALMNGNRRSFTSQLTIEPKFIGLSDNDKSVIGITNTLFDDAFLATYSGVNKLVSIFTFIFSAPTNYIQNVSYTAPINFTSGSTTTLTGLSGQSYDENNNIVQNKITPGFPNLCQFGITPLPICSYGTTIPTFDIFITSLCRCQFVNNLGNIVLNTNFTPAIVLFQEDTSIANFLVQSFVSTTPLRMRSDAPKVPNPAKSINGPISLMGVMSSKIRKNNSRKIIKSNLIHSPVNMELDRILNSKISLRGLFKYFLESGLKL